jgi:cell division transport system permease protein
MTLLVIGVALALPATLQVALKNGQRVAGNINDSTQITLYLHNKINESDGRRLADRLNSDTAIATATYITREQALHEFKTSSGFGDALNYLNENPLPAVIVVTPADSHKSPEQAGFLLSRLRSMSEVEQAQLDMDWLRKLQALMQTGQRAVIVLSVLLALAVILIVGNTIRLAIQNRRTEIEVFKLVGATDAFIRRPFLYNGLWLGLVGGVLAWMMVVIALLWLDNPVTELADLYGSSFRVTGLSSEEVLRLLGFGTLLGLGGSLLSVNRHLKEIEPH